MSKIVKIFINIFDKIRNTLFCRSIRDGMVMALPILLVGSFAVMMNNLPFPGYIDFIQSFGKGFFHIFFDFIQNATFGILSIYVTITISIAFINNISLRKHRIGAVFSALASFFIFAGIFQGNYDCTYLGAKGMFSAVLAGYCAPGLFFLYSKALKKCMTLQSGSTDSIFSESLNSILPFTVTILTFALFNIAFVMIFNVSAINEGFVLLADTIFQNMGRNFGTGFFFLFFVHFLWMFGIHGNNVMQGVSESLFLFDGESIYSKPFIDVFCLAGGSGATWCYILAVLLFSKRKRDKKLETIAILPSLFNINELIVFGTPMICNPVFVIPFISTPLVFYCTSVLSYKIGFLTQLNPVEWTTPIFLSGYVASGSWHGIIVQLVNIVLGTAIYLPFVKLAERFKNEKICSNLNELVSMMKESEKTMTPINLSDGNSNLNISAKYLMDDLKNALKNRELKVYYQSQYDENGKCLGAESLLRWHNEKMEMIYPPLICQLAKEGNFLVDLEKYIFNTVFLEMDELEKVYGPECQISINVTGTTIQKPEFLEFLVDLMNRFRFPARRVCIEITEQDAIPLNEKFISLLSELKECGYSLAIDDFSMGHTSIAYLKTNLFDEVKLDGSLVKDMMKNDRCKEIINSISFLAKSLDFKILAEYVENEEQREMLRALNVHEYQGFLYAKALPLEKLQQGNIE